jgi:hypothetical protein
MYSSEQIQAHMRALRAISQEATQRRIARVIRVERVMNENISQLLGSRMSDNLNESGDASNDS